jgi:hypothetical protein
MEPDGSSSCPQEAATGPYSESDESSPQFYILFHLIPFYYYPHIDVYMPHVVYSLQILWTEIFYAFLIYDIHATCRAHLMLLYLITLIIFGED